MKTMHKWQYKKYMGDDRYSWAVFRDGRVWTSGLDRISAKYEKERCEREDAAEQLEAAKARTVKRLASEVWR